jgi:hypothetical protein
MKYAEYLSTAEAQRWVLDTDIAWDEIDRELALQQPELLERIRDSALIESFFPIFTPRALEVLWDSVDATAVFSIQLYESYKHFHVFNQYLECVGYRPVSDAEIVEVRQRNVGLRYTDATDLLTRYMMSEHFAAYHFMKDARQARELVLSRILKLVGRDEIRHAQFAFDLLAERIREDAGQAEMVLQSARRFRHIGLEVVSEIPQAERNDFPAIVTINERIKRLTGQGIGQLSGEIQHAAL